MKDYTFHFELEDIIQQFAAALNDVIIRRYDIPTRTPVDNIQVNFVYGPKYRTLQDLVNKAQHHKFPCIAISLAGISRDNNRVFNKLDGSWWSTEVLRDPKNARWLDLLQPVPVDISVNVSIISRFQTDIDQILTNFVPYSDPYITISWQWPDAYDYLKRPVEIRSTCHWSGSISNSYPIDVAATQPYWTIADTTFTIKSWMFKNIPPEGKPIYVIDCSFSAMSAMEDWKIMKSIEDDYNTDYFQISARPQIMHATPHFAFISDILEPQKSFQIFGKMMDYVDHVYLSSADWDMFDLNEMNGTPGLVDMFSTSSFYASASYPPFSGVELLSSNWSDFDKNILNFNFTPLTSGTFDVILMNDAGYGIMTQDSIRPTLNPFRPGTPDYDNYIEYQWPCTSGIEIKYADK